MKTLTFENGDQLDAIGLGTWKSEPGEVGRAVKAALETGYRHLDCAAIYGNEPEIGDALKEIFSAGEINRNEVWITSKLWNNAHRHKDVIPALKQTLSDLKLDYLDLYLMHWPVAFQSGLEGFPEKDEDFLSLEEVPLTETWSAMLEAKEQGLIRHAGVSNFSEKKLRNLISGSDSAPEMNQIELHPYLQQDELVDYCMKNNIHITAYSPLGSSDRPDFLKGEDEPSLLENEVITSIAMKHNATPAQILIHWHLVRDIAVIPKSTNPGRIEENFKSADIELDENDLEQIKKLDRHFRYVDGTIFETESDKYRDVFDEA